MQDAFPILNNSPTPLRLVGARHSKILHRARSYARPAPTAILTDSVRRNP